MAGSGTAQLRASDDVLLSVEGVVVEFPVRHSRQRVHAVSDVSFDVARGETLGLVGESGCGKSTLGRAIMQLYRPNSGAVVLDGEDLTQLSEGQLRRLGPRMQMIFQDPISSLNPRRRVADVVAEPLRIWRDAVPDRDEAVRTVLEAVGLDPDLVYKRRPHEFSGGQCQRISIARALVLRPDVLICDEPVSSLDVSVQAQILNLLEAMRTEFNLSMIFIGHDLAVVKNVSDRVAVMYLGKLCEIARADDLYQRPAHPYTAALLDAIPDPDVPFAAGDKLRGVDLPSAVDPPSGCRFRTRCPRAAQRCQDEEPEVRSIGDDHFVACHFPLDD